MESKNENPGYVLASAIRDFLPKNAVSNTQQLNHALLNDPFFVRLMTSSPTSIAIFNNVAMVYEYFSPSMESLLGYPIAKLQGTSGPEFAFNTFHPDHIQVAIKQMERVKKFYQEYSVQKRVLDSRYTFTLQLKRGNGKYIWTLMQTVVLEVGADNLPVRSVIFVTDITDIKSTSKVDFAFSVKNKDGLGFETVYVSHHDATSEYKLSEREIDVLNCIRKGMRNHEIALSLNISKHTVITHRRNIMKKSGKENIIQLLVD